jgi:hypothetical protein
MKEKSLNSKFSQCAWSARAVENGSILKIDVRAVIEGRYFKRRL